MGDEVARITGELEETSNRLTIAVEEYTDACREAANKRTDYDVSWAKNLLRAEGKTVSEREAEVTIIYESYMRSARIAEGMRDAHKERVRALYRPVASFLIPVCRIVTTSGGGLYGVGRNAGKFSCDLSFMRPVLE